MCLEESNDVLKLFQEGLDLYKKQLYSEAAKRWRAVLTLDPEYPNIEMYLSVCERQELQTMSFLEGLEMARSSKEGDFELVDQLEERKREFADHIEQSKKAEAEYVLELMFSERSSDPEYLRFLIQAYREMGNLEKMQKMALRLVQVEPFTARSHFLLGNCYFLREDYALAHGAYSKALLLRPDSFRLLFNLALVSITRKDPVLAKEYLSRAALIRPDDKGLKKLELRIQDTMGDLVERLSELEEETKDSTYPDAHYRLALLYSKTAHLEKAYASLQRALNLNPTYREALYEAGRIQVELEEYEKAYETLNTLCECLENKPHGRENVVQFAKSGYFEEAATQYLKILRMEPDFGAIHIELGKEYYKAKLYTKGLNELEKGLYLSPEYADGHYFLGLVQLGLKKKVDAARCFQEALDLNPLYHEAAFELIRLKEKKEPGFARKIVLAQLSCIEKDHPLKKKFEKILKRLDQ